MIKIEQSILGVCQTNTYYAYNPVTGKGFIVDPADSADIIIETVHRLNFVPEAILITHGHFDHIMAAKELKDRFNADVYIGDKEKEALHDGNINLSVPFMGQAYTMDADRYMADGQEFNVAGYTIKTIHTPGHTAGGVCYYIENEKILFSGDTLFYRSIGRTDFPGGSTLSLIASVKSGLFVLPDDVNVYPGHMESTTIGDEKINNPFCR